MPGKTVSGACQHHKNGAYTVTAHTFPDGTTREICGVCMKTWTSGIPKLVRTHINNLSKNNVVLHEILSASDPMPQYALRCKVCSTQLFWNWSFQFEELGIDKEKVIEFCTLHAECENQDVPKAESSVLMFKNKEKPKAQPIPVEPKGRKFREYV